MITLFGKAVLSSLAGILAVQIFLDIIEWFKYEGVGENFKNAFYLLFILIVVFVILIFFPIASCLFVLVFCGISSIIILLLLLVIAKGFKENIKFRANILARIITRFRKGGLSKKDYARLFDTFDAILIEKLGVNSALFVSLSIKVTMSIFVLILLSGIYGIFEIFHTYMIIGVFGFWSVCFAGVVILISVGAVYKATISSFEEAKRLSKSDLEMNILNSEYL